MKRRQTIRMTAFLCIAAALPATMARAGFQAYELTYSGAAFGNNATAIATITLDLAELVNPGFTEQDVSPFVTAFSITVSGANLGNGTFGISNYLGWPENFGGFFLDTNGADWTSPGNSSASPPPASRTARAHQAMPGTSPLWPISTTTTRRLLSLGPPFRSIRMAVSMATRPCP
jgi:hypothetical protein